MARMFYFDNFCVTLQQLPVGTGSELIRHQSVVIETLFRVAHVIGAGLFRVRDRHTKCSCFTASQLQAQTPHRTQNTEHRTQNSDSTQNPEPRTQNTEPRTQNSDSTQNPEHRTQNSDSTQNPEHRTQNTEHRTQNTEHRTQNSDSTQNTEHRTRTRAEVQSGSRVNLFSTRLRQNRRTEGKSSGESRL